MAQLSRPQYKIVVDHNIHIFKTVKASNKFIKEYCFNNDFSLIRNSYVDGCTISYNLRSEGVIVLRYEKIHFESELTTLN